MYPVSDATKTALLNNAYQDCSIEVKSGSTTQKTLTNADILSLTIDRYTCSGNQLEMGSAIAAELTMKLFNSDGRFDDFSFEGKTLVVSIEVNSETIPMGTFIVDVTPRKLSVITIQALDLMTKFDKTFEKGTLVYPCTLSTLINHCCTKCGVGASSSLLTFLNSSKSVTPNLPSDATYRDVVSWVAELAGSCAYINESGKLALGWYNTTADSSTPTLTKAVRYTSDIYENTATIDSVKVQYLKKTIQVGASNYFFFISNNPVLTDDFNLAFVTDLYNACTITYTPFSATTLPMPYMYPMDCIKVTTKNSTVTTTITNVTWTLNGRTEFKAKGVTDTVGTSVQNPITRSTQAAIDNSTDDVKETVVLDSNFSRFIANGLGLYDLSVESGGVTTFYFGNNDTLEDSTLIYTFNTNGFAWTNDWNDGDPEWQYGVAADGNAVFKQVTATYINALGITAKKIEVKNGNDTVFMADATNTTVKMATWDVTKDYIGSSAGSPPSGTWRAMWLYSAAQTNQANWIKCQDNYGTDAFLVKRDGSVYCSDLNAQGGYFSGTLDAQGETSQVGACVFESSIDSQTGRADSTSIATNSVTADTMRTELMRISASTLSKKDGSSTSITRYFTGTVQIKGNTEAGALVIATVKSYSNSGHTVSSAVPESTKVNVTITKSGDYTYTVPVTLSAGSSSGTGVLSVSSYVASGYTTSLNITQKTYSTYTSGGLEINSNFLPSSDDTYNLGSENEQWAEIWGTTVYSDGNAVTSDRRLKTDINYNLAAYDGVIDKLKPVSYRFKGKGKTHLGFIAQDVEESLGGLPGIVDKHEDLYTLAYAELHALEIKEIQALKEEIKSLKETIKHLTEDKK